MKQGHEENFVPGSDGGHSEQPLALLSLQNGHRAIKTKHPVDINIFEMSISDGGVIPLFIFPQVFKLNTKAYMKCLDEVMLHYVKRVADGRLDVWEQHSALFLKAGEDTHHGQTISAMTSPPNSGLQTPHTATHLVSRCGVELSMNKDELMTRIMAAFTNLKRRMP